MGVAVVVATAALLRRPQAVGRRGRIALLASLAHSYNGLPTKTSRIVSRASAFARSMRIVCSSTPRRTPAACRVAEFRGAAGT